MPSQTGHTQQLVSLLGVAAVAYLYIFLRNRPQTLLNELLCCCLPGMIKQASTGTALWIGGHDSVTESGWEWMDGSPFRYVHWSEGSFCFFCFFL